MNRFRPNRWLTIALSILPLLQTSGCDGNQSPSNELSELSSSTSSEASRRSASHATAEALPISEDEAWYGYYLAGQKVGYGHTTAHVVEEAGQKKLKTQGASFVTFSRGENSNKAEIRIESTETLAGEMTQVSSIIDLGGAPTRAIGHVENGDLHLTVATSGKTTNSTIPWPAAAGGPFADEHSLRRKPLEPGERRVVQVFQPLFHQAATVQLSAGDYEQTEVLSSQQELLSIARVVRLSDGQTITSKLWVDRQGKIVKTYEPPGLEMIRVSKDIALEASSSPDLVAFSFIPIDPPIDDPFKRDRILYEVFLPDGDPIDLFPNSTRQQVQRVDDHRVRIDVRAIRSDDMPPQTHRDGISGSFLQPNNLIQSDAPLIVQMAEKAAGDWLDPGRSARELERFVHRSIRTKDFSQGFATALDVAQNLEGDCTEHAVLLAALARAREIPARVAMGLVYVARQKGFGYHMWNELYIKERWVPFDGTLGQGGVTATHIKLADSDLNGGSAYTSFLPVARVLGKLKIEVIEAE